ncbi:MAG: ABC transporter permease, partial [Prevotella sp.]|nr:ABC transporter permease [Prevotella sp.]
MIKHIYSIIWNERKINIWILIELVLVFCILWFCVDYSYFYMKRYFEPKGFDVDHVYNINLGMKTHAGEPNYEETLDDFRTIVDRIEKYPEIESFCVSIAAMPYSGSYSNYGCFIDTASIVYVQVKAVTSGYFDVFKIEKISGDLSEWDNASSNSNIISGDKDNILLDMPVNRIKTFKLGSKNDYQELKITGIAAPVKR